MRRREFIALLGGGAAAWPLMARAQQPVRMRRIGALMDIGETDAAAKGWVEAFETGLDAAGWHKGRNCEINYRWGASEPERLARNAEELVQSAPDVFLVHGTPALIPLKKTIRRFRLCLRPSRTQLDRGSWQALPTPAATSPVFPITIQTLVANGCKFLRMSLLP